MDLTKFRPVTMKTTGLNVKIAYGPVTIQTPGLKDHFSGPVMLISKFHPSKCENPLRPVTIKYKVLGGIKFHFT